jgi:tartrate-resistant acid phosphatase type 5
VGMNTIAAQLNAQFVVAAGDNVYAHGAVDEFDVRFKESFENVYGGAALQKPWYAVFGNHDYKGNTTAQLEYVKHSTRWQFPSPFYKNSFTAEDGATMDLIMIDTSMFYNLLFILFYSYSYFCLSLFSFHSSVDLASMTDKEVDEEGYFDPLPLLGKEQAADQWSWIESELKSSTADYILVVGHYPVSKT